LSFIEKISGALSDSLDYLIDKNRQRAQLNRMATVIKNETEILNRAYIALGKHYYKTLDGKAEDSDISQILDTIKSAKIRLKKAKTRYEYIFRYGVPTPGIRDDISVAYLDNDDITSCNRKEKTSENSDEDQDITIAVKPE
jgi:hypothetical protein